MRITGGNARGITLTTGGNEAVRPATDRLREAVFSSLGSSVEGARCLDLFAGTGAYGLEALSRGAASVVFVEQNRKSAAAIAHNIAAVCKSMGAPPSVARAQQRDVFTWQAGADSFDLVFADPPYALLPGRAADIFRVVLAALADNGLFVFEMPGELDLKHPTLTLLRRLGKGRHQPGVAVYKRMKDEGCPGAASDS